MAFFLSKALWLLVRPSHLLLILVFLGTILLFTRWRRVGRLCVAVGTSILLAITVLPIAGWMAAPLEDRFAAPTSMPDKVDGIVVLGGGLESSPGDVVGLNAAGDRVVGLLVLARRYPDARVVYTGGSGSLRPGTTREADLAEELLRSVGFDADRVAFERRSRNTRENAVFSRQLAEPAPDETWLLVTSAQHMPRSVGSFRREGWPVVPYPVDHQVERNVPVEERIDLSGNLRAFEFAAREWVGLLAYYWLGYTDAFFPGPAGPD